MPRATGCKTEYGCWPELHFSVSVLARVQGSSRNSPPSFSVRAFQRPKSASHATMSSDRVQLGSSELIASKIDGPLLNLLIDERTSRNLPLHRYYCAMMAPFRHFVDAYALGRSRNVEFQFARTYRKIKRLMQLCTILWISTKPLANIQVCGCVRWNHHYCNLTGRHDCWNKGVFG